jgi:hypothetical protein
MVPWFIFTGHVNGYEILKDKVTVICKKHIIKPLQLAIGRRRHSND